MSDIGADHRDRIAQITMERSVAGVRLVGVDGPAGAGKSTIARALTTRF